MVCSQFYACYQNQLKNSLIDDCPNCKTLCVKTVNYKIVKCSENGKSYSLSNPKQYLVAQFKMDGGIIVNDQTSQKIKKCDYVYLMDQPESVAILIELKGNDISKGIKQLEQTLLQFSGVWKNFNKIYGRLIVSYSSPRLRANPNYVKLYEQFRKLNGNLRISEKCLEEQVPL